MTTNIIPEETLIYKELKSKFEVSDPELWKEVEMNLKQVIEDKTMQFGFTDKKLLLDCFVWQATKQGFRYWENIYFKHGMFVNE